MYCSNNNVACCDVILDNNICRRYIIANPNARGLGKTAILRASAQLNPNMFVTTLSSSQKEAIANNAYRKETERLSRLRTIDITITPAPDSNLDPATHTFTLPTGEEDCIASVVEEAEARLPALMSGEYEFRTMTTGTRLSGKSMVHVSSLVPAQRLQLEIQVRVVHPQAQPPRKSGFKGMLQKIGLS